MTVTPLSNYQLQPREKLLKKGVSSLSDAELLAIFLRTGVTGCPALELARKLLDNFGSLRAIFHADMNELCLTKGVGCVKYIQLQATLEMAKRYFWEEIEQLPMLTSASQAEDYIYVKMQHLPREVFSCLFLSSQNQVIHYQEVFQGTINQAPVFPRELARLALEYNAAAVILAHNHPSGIAEPSSADKAITHLIKEALELLDVRVLDHLVVGKNRVYSFATHGLL